MSNETDSKRLVILIQGREIARSALLSPSILVGRSPVCDFVVRAPGVKPVHFLIEWMGSGDFHPNEGEWSITDISSASGMAESQVASQVVGQGAVLDEKPVTLGDFEFKWVMDRLSETVLEGGSLMKQVRDLQTTVLSADGMASVLEVITVNPEMDRVTQIHHLDMTASALPQNRLRDLPPLNITWDPNNRVAPLQLQLVGASIGAKILQKGVPLNNDNKPVGVGKGDLLQIQWQMKDYYFRLVPRVQAPPTPLAITKDPFYRWLGLATLIFILFILFIWNGDFKKIEAPEPPPRLAKIEVQEIAKPLPMQMEVPPPPEPTPEKEVPKQTAEPLNLPPTKAQMARSNKAPEPSKPKVGLDSPAPVKNVNSVGLLGSLKKTRNTVSADKVINDGIVSRTATGDEGQFVVKQPPSGVLGRKTVQNRDAGLAGASTTISGGDPLAARSAGPIVDTVGSHQISIGGGSNSTSNEGGGDDAQSVEGGLDSETVRRTLSAYRKEIRTCYERALNLKPRIKGRIVYQWTISGQGATTTIKQLRSTAGSPTLEGCVMDVIKAIRWPKSANGTPTIVKYPYEFQSRN